MAHAVIDQESSKASEFLSMTLEFVIGSEEVIKTRQQVIAETNIDIPNESEYFKQLICGGSSEGFRLPNQDADVMVVLKQIPVYDHQSKIPTDKFCIRLSYGACYTGSVMLEVYRYIDHGSEDPALEILDKCCDKYNHRHVLNASKFKRSYYDKAFSDMHDAKITGPVAKRFGGVFDMAMAFQAFFWPKCAHEWVYRNRKYNWPCKPLIKFIVSDVGCNIVPTCDISSQEQDLLWRLSFSRAETILVSLLSYVQYKVFAVMKMFLKSAINDGLEEEQSFLTSYHIKNMIFYMAEMLPRAQWTDEKLLDRFWDCMTYLRKSLQQDYLPHYFLPGLNLFVKHWNKDHKATAIHKIDQYLQNKKCTNTLISCIIQTYWQCNLDTFGEQCLKTRFDKEFVNDSAIWEGHVFELNCEYFEREQLYSAQKLKKACSKFCQDKSVTLCRRNLDNITFHLVLKSLEFLKLSKICIENKKTYYFSRKSKRLLLVCCNADISRGWLTLAYYYFQISDFKMCLHICNKSINCPLMWIQSELYHANKKTQHYLKEITGKQLETFQKFKIANFFSTEFHSIHLQELDKEFNETFSKPYEYILPLTYASILLFSSCNQLGDVSGCHKAIGELKKQTQILCRDYNNTNAKALLASTKAAINCCMGVCYEILGDKVKAKLNYVKAIDILPQYSPARTKFRRLLKS